MPQELDLSRSASYALGHKRAADAHPKPQIPLGLILDINNGWGKLEVVLRSPMIIGRSDQDQDVDIDLSRFNAREMGISRNHATLMLQGAQLFIKDLGSKNGTRINMSRLIPDKFYELQEGDMVLVGKMKLVPTFTYEPKANPVLEISPTAKLADPLPTSPDAPLTDNSTFDVRQLIAQEIEESSTHQPDE